jgi:predicted HTH transcriptional regulator
MTLSKERMKEYMKQYRLDHPEYKEKHKEQSIERFKEKYHNDETFRLGRLQYIKDRYNNNKKTTPIEV